MLNTARRRQNRQMRYSQRLLTTAAMLQLAAIPAFAQVVANEDADDPVRIEDTIVVTGSSTPVEAAKIGNSLTVVSDDLIEEGGYNYVPDVLRQVPGVAVNRTGPTGGLTQVRIRGAEGNHTLVLLDGIDISSPDQGETDFSTLLTNDIERIEVLRGPQSGLYGSNALAGVVNLITRQDIDGEYLNLSAEAGEFSTYQFQANAGLGSGGNYLSAGVQILDTEGYDISADTAAQGVPAVGRGGERGDEEGNNITTLYLRGGRVITPNLKINAIGRYLTKSSELDGQAYNAPISGATYDDASRTDTDQLMIGASATLSSLDNRLQTVLSGSHVDEERRGLSTSFPLLAGPPLPGDLDVPLSPNGADATRTKFSLKSTLQFGPQDYLSYLTGFIEHKEETYQNPFPSSPAQASEQSRELLGIGAEYRIEILDQLFLSATYRHDDNDEFTDADTYSAAASWVIPNTGTRLHASYGTGVTNPTFFEQFGFNPGTFVGNPNLVPEEATGWDAGIEQTLLNGRMIVDVTYFESELEKEIFTAFGPPPNFLSTPDNRATESDRSGVEATFQVFPTDNIDIVGSYTYLDATEPAGIEVRRPENQAALDANWRVTDRAELNVGVTYNGEQVDTDFGTYLRTEIDAYTLIRLGASYQLTERLEGYVRVENVADEEYEEVIAYRGSPRAAYVGLRLKLGSGA